MQNILNLLFVVWKEHKRTQIVTSFHSIFERSDWKFNLYTVQILPILNSRCVSITKQFNVHFNSGDSNSVKVSVYVKEWPKSIRQRKWTWIRLLSIAFTFSSEITLPGFLMTLCEALVLFSITLLGFIYLDSGRGCDNTEELNYDIQKTRCSNGRKTNLLVTHLNVVVCSRYVVWMVNQNCQSSWDRSWHGIARQFV